MNAVSEPNPLVNVIIPVYNRSHVLKECLESVASQSYRALEVIVVDDASDENIEDVLRLFQDRFDYPPIYIRSTENVGPGAARELGRKVATGAFICYLDADDLWHEDKVSLQVEVLHASPHADMCYCTSLEFSKLPLTGAEPLRHKSNKRVEYFLPEILTGRPWGTGACMWTRRATDLIGPWSAGWAWEDYEYESRAGCLELKIVSVPQVLCYYRRSADGKHLSNANEALRITRKFASQKLILQNLKQSGYLARSDIVKPLTAQLFTTATDLLGIKQFDLAAECLQLLLLVPCGIPRRLAVCFTWILVLFRGNLPFWIAQRLRWRYFTM